MIQNKYYLRGFIFCIAAIVEIKINGSLIHVNNIRQRVEEISKQFLCRYNIYEYDIPVKIRPEYDYHITTIVANAQQKISNQRKSSIDSDELSCQVKQEMLCFINTMKSIVRLPDIDVTVTNAIHQELSNDGLSSDDIPSYMVCDYHKKGAYIVSKLRSNMSNDHRDYVRRAEIEKIVHDEMRFFIQQIKNNQAKNASPQSGWRKSYANVQQQNQLPTQATPQTPLFQMKYSKEDSCSICLGNYNSQERVGQLGCGHVFHNDCIRSWLEYQKNCPLCRSENVIVAKIETVD
jgi:hypothetical protein